MGQDFDKYQRLIALAGWMWVRLASAPTFRQSDLAKVQNFEHLGATDAAGLKALRRAFDDLREFGILVEWDAPVPNDRDPQAAGAYRISGVKLTPNEQKAVLELGFTVRYNDLSAEAASRIPGSFLEGAAEGLMLESNRFIGPLSRAIYDRECIEAMYGGGDETRVLQPIRLGFSRGQWYAAALDPAAGNTVKVFRVDRFHSVEGSEAPWADDFDVDIADQLIGSLTDRFSWGDEEDRVLRMSVDEAALPAVLRLFPDSTVEGNAGRSEWWSVTRHYRSTENVVDAIVSLGTRVVVEEPPELRTAVIEWLSGITEASA